MRGIATFALLLTFAHQASGQDLPSRGLSVSGVAQSKSYSCDFTLTLGNQLAQRLDFLSGTIEFGWRGRTERRGFNAGNIMPGASQNETFLLPMRCDDEFTASIVEIDNCRIGGKSLPHLPVTPRWKEDAASFIAAVRSGELRKRPHRIEACCAPTRGRPPAPAVGSAGRRAGSLHPPLRFSAMNSTPAASRATGRSAPPPLPGLTASSK